MTASPDSPTDNHHVHVGIIGMGDMGRLYAKHIAAAGFRARADVVDSVHVCDLPHRFEALREDYKGHANITVWKDGFGVSRRCDYIIYSVEASSLDKVVGMYGPATKLGAIVGGQTSVKEPEIRAFETHLPDDVSIVTAHSMHGPTVDPSSQAMVVIRHRAPDAQFQLAWRVLSSLGSEMVEMTHEEHDVITADTQAVTHAAFLRLLSRKSRPPRAGGPPPRAPPPQWETNAGSIDSIKIHLTLRIYSNKWHVYAGLALQNPSARLQTRQYARSVADLFSLMITQNEAEFVKRVAEAGTYVFGLPENWVEGYEDPVAGEGETETVTARPRRRALLPNDLLDEFERHLRDEARPSPDAGDGGGWCNSHLALLAIADCWRQLGMDPYAHLVCVTPVFGLWMGITEHLFHLRPLLHLSVRSALHHLPSRADDMQFVASVAGWADVVETGSFEAYRERFDAVAGFFDGQQARRRRKASDVGQPLATAVVGGEEEEEEVRAALEVRKRLLANGLVGKAAGVVNKRRKE
ncbi:prephenate dehydrogenase (NADP(+)) [Phlyctochytrium bullatum]|nr:prephenate dehydrogenase (NADP(+)) [Phlyctochytrium bullatum]